MFTRFKLDKVIFHFYLVVVVVQPFYQLDKEGPVVGVFGAKSQAGNHVKALINSHGGQQQANWR